MDQSSPPNHETGPRPWPIRIAALKEFLPLSHDEPSIASTRGQNLPAIIKSYSSASLASLARSRRARQNSIGPTESLRQQNGSNHRRDSNDTDSSYGGTELAHHHSAVEGWGGGDDAFRRMSLAADILMTPHVRSQRLIGYNNPRYQWEQYWSTDEDLKKMRKKGVRQYYERNNYLIQHYMYIDRLLDSSLPHDLIREYQQVSPQYTQGAAEEAQNNRSPDYGTVQHQASVPETIDEEDGPPIEDLPNFYPERHGSFDSIFANGDFQIPPEQRPVKVKRTPKDLYQIRKSDVQERRPLLEPPELAEGESRSVEDAEEGRTMPPDLEFEEEANAQSPIVTVAIIINLVANAALLIMKLVVVVLSSSVSVLASLIDAALDFLSTAIVGITTRLISRTDQYAYPIGRRRLEPVGVLVFSVIMITAFLQVLWEAFVKLTSGEHEVVALSVSAIAIMASTVVIKFACWLWCRLIKNSSVQALAQDAMTDVVFNTFSIVFPLVGYYTNTWWLDPVGGIFLSLYVIINWSSTANQHIRNLTGASATADERNILLYLTMRFAKTIKQIQGLQAYHSGDKLNVEVDIVLDEATSLRDSHDLGESLQYVLESVPTVDRAFVHMDYTSYNLPTHMQQDS